MNGVCVPCAWRNGVSDYKKQKLLSDAKRMAIENKKYYSIIFDEEDKEFEVIEYEEAKSIGIKYIQDTLSPYQRITT